MFDLCVLRALYGSSLLPQQKQNNHRGHRAHRAEQTEGRQQNYRQLRCAAGGVAFRGADSWSAPCDVNATLPFTASLPSVAAEALAGYCLPLRALASTSRSAAW
jgi:hypothetical protein